MTADEKDQHFVVFAVEGQRHAVDLRRVARVVHAVAIAPLPGAPAVVDGVVNVHGSLVAAVSMRKRLGLPPRPVRLADHFLLVSTAHAQLLLMTDAVRDVRPLSRQLVKGAASPPGDFVAAVVHVEDGVIMIDDVDRLLQPAELAQLQRALGDAERAIA